MNGYDYQYYPCFNCTAQIGRSVLSNVDLIELSQPVTRRAGLITKLIKVKLLDCEV